VRKDRKLLQHERADAREALDLLVGSDLSLAECVRIALQIDGDGGYRKLSLEMAIDEYLDHCRQRVKNGSMRARTVDFYDDHLWAFERAFPGKEMDEFNSRMLKSYFESGSRTQWRAVRALFNWAEKQDPQLVRRNPVRGVSLSPVVKEEEIRFLSVEEAQSILAIERPELRRAFALALFAGIRPEEFNSHEKPGLRWEHVNREEKLIRIPADMAKGSRRRSMARLIDQAPENLWSWLQDAPESGLILDMLPRQMTYWAKKLAGYGSGRKWPDDGLRHTFATYHVAAFNDVAKTSLIMGHRGNADMIHRHYRGLATKSQGEAFFGLAG